MTLGDLRGKYEAFGWDVMEVNGNDIAELIAGFQKAKKMSGQGKPVLMLMTTIMGNGVDFMMNGNAWHGKAPSDEQTASAMSQNAETLGDY